MALVVPPDKFDVVLVLVPIISEWTVERILFIASFGLLPICFLYCFDWIV